MQNDYLIHHGVKGQKWGVRRYQNPDGSYTEEGKARRRVDPDTGLSADTLELLLVTYSTTKMAVNTYRYNKFCKYLKDGQSKELRARDKNTKPGIHDGDIPKGFTKINADHSSYEAVIKDKACNPNNGYFSNMNCLACSMVAEMRRRGIDVTATSGIRYFNGRPIYDTKEIFNNPSTIVPPQSQKMSQAALGKWVAKQYPPGSRGMINVMWKFGGGHAMSWELGENGEFIIADPQSGEMVPKRPAFQAFMDGWQRSYITRLDHLDIRTDTKRFNQLVSNDYGEYDE